MAHESARGMDELILRNDKCSLIILFRVSIISRIFLFVLLISAETTVRGVLLSVDSKETLLVGDCGTVDLSKATEEELVECKGILQHLLNKVDLLMNKKVEKRAKRYSPISSSLPNRESAFFLDRINAIRILRQEDQQRNNENKEEQPNHQKTKPFVPKRNNSAEQCKRLSQQELVSELKQKGTYNPDLMAWDASGVIRFLDRSIVDQYEKQLKTRPSSEETTERNVEALERIFEELDLHCDVRSPSVVSRLRNLTSSEPRRTVVSPSIRISDTELRSKRQTAEGLVQSLQKARAADAEVREDVLSQKRQKLIGDVHLVPFGCDKRGGEEDGYLRLCGACQAIRRLPDTFFPPFINEVMCDDDKACLYFYDFPHGKCKQKHMNFVVLKNVGTDECQVWQKFNLNVRVSCECFVDEMSFFAKYV